jgi:hypothetical protein
VSETKKAPAKKASKPTVAKATPKETPEAREIGLIRNRLKELLSDSSPVSMERANTVQSLRLKLKALGEIDIP